jgi:hypothetical protein
MSLRSLLLLLLIAAAFLAAQWTDVLHSTVLNITAKKVCAVDNPEYCIFAPVLNGTIDIRTTYAVAVFHDAEALAWRATSVLSPYTLVVYNPSINITVRTPAGYILAPETVAVDGMVPDLVPLCGRNMTAVRVDAGTHRIAGSFYYPCGSYFCYQPVRFLNPKDCGAVSLAEHAFMLNNVTSRWAYVYILYMPTAKEVRVDAINEILNGTAHVYYTYLRVAPPAGDGIYIANKTRVSAVAAGLLGSSLYVGPKAHDMLTAEMNFDYYIPKFVLYTIGRFPGDGVAAVQVPGFLTLTAPYELAFTADDTAGYFKLRVIPDDSSAHIFVQRYAVVEVALSDGIYMYTTRTIACPPYQNTTARHIYTIPARANAAKEIEICSNKTAAAYLALSVSYYGWEYFTFIDKVEPGDCARLRWDGMFRAADTKLYIYPSAQAVCLLQPEAEKIGGQDYLPGWRYYLMPDNSLVPANPIDPDVLYAELWKQIIQSLAQQYNEMVKAQQQWLQMQANATKKIEDYYKSLPQYQGTIQMSSSTSTWLQTVLNVISRYTVPGVSAGIGVTAAPPGISSLSAAAAAVAVATAWAASRRSLAAAAFLAGFAVLASALFVYYLFGTSVTVGLVLAAVVLMSIGAAAAWFRKTED